MKYGYVRETKFYGESVDKQIEEIMSFTKGEHVEITNDISGLTDSIKEGDILFIESADIFSDDILEAMDIRDEIEGKGVNIISIHAEKFKIELENKRKNLKRGIKYGYTKSIDDLDKYTEAVEKLRLYGADKMINRLPILESLKQFNEGDELIVNNFLDLEDENIHNLFEIMGKLQKKKVILTILNQ